MPCGAKLRYGERKGKLCGRDICKYHKKIEQVSVIILNAVQHIKHSTKDKPIILNFN